MMLKRSTNESKPGFSARLVRAGVASLAAAGAMAALATGCLDRPVVKQAPTTSNVYVDQIVQTAVDKIDLLFMIDNSVSMQDKQEILKTAVPVLVQRLIAPICVNADGSPVVPSENSDGGHCSKGAPEFSPIGDIHIGIVSSSLGAHGGTVCATPDGPTGTPDDKARLIPSVRSGVASWNDQGFLAWDLTGTKNTPPGVKDPKALKDSFQNMITAVGEHGCGYEASLESWYRFLIDPEPPANVTKVDGFTVRGSKLTVNADGSTGACEGCDDVVLQQRKKFLRPDSLVAIVMLSDENDCSIRDDSVGWFVGSGSRMPKSTEVCESNPNDPCCRSCAQNESSPPAGCAALSADNNCKNPPAMPPYNTWDLQNDSPNLRCYNQKQRFGFDLLYDTNRYVNALKSRNIALQSTGQVVINPLYDNTGSGKAPRDPSLVFLAGIVGVPWQDIATDASLTDPKALTYLTAKELVEKDRWSVLLGDPHPKDGSAPKPPTDPFMIETPIPRTAGTPNPIPGVNAQIQPANSTNPKANVINGHEQNTPDLSDLQYACIFPLETPKKCAAKDAACDCSPDQNNMLTKVVAANSPLCQNAQGQVTDTQTYAKAYPGSRELQVLKDYGDNAIVASICPKVTTTTGDRAADPNYGYNPAVGAIIERLKEALKGKCLPRKIQSVLRNPDQPELGTEVACKVVEAQRGTACDCGLPGRRLPDEQIKPAVRQQLKDSAQCGVGANDSCDDWCMCEVVQVEDTAGCQAGAQTTPGFCYVDDPASPLLKDCPSNQKQLLRFVDEPTNKIPAQGAVAFIACLGASEDPDEPTTK